MGGWMGERAGTVAIHEILRDQTTPFFRLIGGL